MKKLLFTVYAVCGICAISVANNHVEYLDSQLKSTIVLSSDCDERQQIATDLALEMGSGDAEAYFYGAAEWGRCMAGN